MNRRQMKVSPVLPLGGYPRRRVKILVAS